MTYSKTKIVLGIATATLTITGALVSPQVAAKSKVKHAAHAEMMDSKSDALEAQVNQLANTVQALQAELSRVKTQANRPDPDSGRIQELEQWVATTKAKPVESKSHDNLIFFRGGFAHNDSKRNDLLTGNQFAGNALGGGRTNSDGWYIGAGFDFGLTDDIWGLVDNTELDAELQFDYRNFGAKNFNGAAPGAAAGTVGANPACTLINLAAVDSAGAPGLAGTANCNGVTVSQFTLTAAPKIKFLKGSNFRPWIIPFGLSINVISPPSNGVTVLNPGAVFGAGAEYKIWKAIHVGTDVRYNLTGRSVDGVNTDGLTAGGYLGIGF
ncbi:MAG: porin family protein [Methylococcaceae bacterium]|jgi:outer membrane murein-binding lipoprotein Lpp